PGRPPLQAHWVTPRRPVRSRGGRSRLPILARGSLGIASAFARDVVHANQMITVRGPGKVRLFTEHGSPPAAGSSRRRSVVPPPVSWLRLTGSGACLVRWDHDHEA